MDKPFEVRTGNKQPRIEALPTIAAAIEDEESLRVLKNAIANLNASDRQIFLEGLQTAESFLKLENERLDLKTALKEIVPTGVGSAIALTIVLLLIPTAAGGVLIGASALGTTDLLKARLRKRAAIAKLKELRDATISAGKNARSG